MYGLSSLTEKQLIDLYLITKNDIDKHKHESIERRLQNSLNVINIEGQWYVNKIYYSILLGANKLYANVFEINENQVKYTLNSSKQVHTQCTALFLNEFQTN